MISDMKRMALVLVCTRINDIIGLYSMEKFRKCCKGMLSCKNNGIRVEDHFAGVSKMVTMKVEPIEVEDYMLTRYACYLIH